MYTKTPPIEPITPTYHIRILDDEQLAQLGSGTFEILEKTGFHYTDCGRRYDCPDKGGSYRDPLQVTHEKTN